MSIWDAGTYECEKWVDGKEVIATLHGRDGGGLGGTATFALIHTGTDGDEKQWLIHRMDAVKRVTSPPSAPAAAAELPRIEPMLATLASVDDLAGREWVFETKWDGYRAVAYVCRGRASLRSRNGRDLTETYPELAEVGELLGDHCAVLDGEIVALDSAGRSRFEALQQHGARRARAHLMVFDVLYLDGRSLVREPYESRRATLESLRLSGGFVHVPVVLGSDPDAAVRVSKELQLEGVIAKTRDGVYQPGVRARTWLKIKNQRMQEVIVVGWRPGAGSRAGTIGSLLLAVGTDTGLTYVGRVGTGFNQRSLADAQARLSRLERRMPAVRDVPAPEARDAVWVRPSEVGEVTFAEWTSTGRLRHPVWRGWRPDKSPDDVMRADG